MKHDMDKKMRYTAPRVKKSTEVEMDQAILLGSVVEKRLEVETAGHQNVDHGTGFEAGFNTEWK